MRPIVAKDLMSSDVLTVSEDLTVKELAAFFMENEITGAPVEGEDGSVTGVVSLVDLARADAEHTEDSEDTWEPPTDGYYDRPQDRLGETGIHVYRLGNETVRVRDIMNPKLYSVGPQAEVSEIASKMLSTHIHRLLVVEDNELVGVISTSDLLGLLVDEE